MQRDLRRQRKCLVTTKKLSERFFRSGIADLFGDAMQRMEALSQTNAGSMPEYPGFSGFTRPFRDSFS